MNQANQSVGSPLVRNAHYKKSRLTQVMAVFFMLGGVQVATQYFAYTFQFNPSLVCTLIIYMRRGRLLNGVINGTATIQICLNCSKYGGFVFCGGFDSDACYENGRR